jgi:hypothetical protein
MSEQQDIKQMLAQKVAERVPQRDKFNILFITDRDSRLYPLRGITAMEDLPRSILFITLNVTSDGL